MSERAISVGKFSFYYFLTPKKTSRSVNFHTDTFPRNLMLKEMIHYSRKNNKTKANR